jgi:hypothetical protein
MLPMQPRQRASTQIDKKHESVRIALCSPAREKNRCGDWFALKLEHLVRFRNSNEGSTGAPSNGCDVFVFALSSSTQRLLLRRDIFAP